MSDQYDIPQSVKFSTDDKLDFSYFQSKQARKITESQKGAAERIANNADLNTAKLLIGIDDAANEIANSIDEMAERIVNGFEDLKATFDWKLSEMIWILEQQRQDLKKIVEILQKPLTIQAIELRNRAEYAYRNGFVSDAIKDFEDSIKLNPYDFTNYHNLGNIYLFRERDPERALGYYNMAAKYARPQSNKYMSFALLHSGFANYILGRYQDAYNATKEAIEKYPDFVEAYYRHAQYCSKLGKYDEALNNLRIAIDNDRRYCAKALSEKEDFVIMGGQLTDFFENLRNEMNNVADQEIEKTNRLINRFGFMGLSNDAKEKFEKAIKLRKAGTYLSCRNSVDKARISQKIIINSLIPKLSSQNSKLKSQISNLLTVSKMYSYNEIESLNKMIAENSKIIKKVESEKEKINADRILLLCNDFHFMQKN